MICDVKVGGVMVRTDGEQMLPGAEQISTCADSKVG